MENIDFLQTLLQLGWPAIVLIQCVLLWRDNVSMRDRLIAYLENKDLSARRIDASTIHSGED